jgi:hypothetical protein
MKKGIFTRWFAVWSLALGFLSWTSLSIRNAAATEKAGNAPTTDSRLDLVTALRAMGPHPSMGDQAKVFGLLVGTWDAEYTEFSKDGKPTNSSGEVIFGWVMDGRAVQDLFIIYPSAAHKEKFIGTNLCYFDPKSGTWRATFIDPENDSVVRFTGGAVGDDRIVLQSQDTDGKETRWSFNDIRPDFFVFRDEVSSDGGKTWRLREEDHMKRRGAAPVCAVIVVACLHSTGLRDRIYAAPAIYGESSQLGEKRMFIYKKRPVRAQGADQ